MTIQLGGGRITGSWSFCFSSFLCTLYNIMNGSLPFYFCLFVLFLKKKKYFSAYSQTKNPQENGGKMALFWYKKKMGRLWVKQKEIANILESSPIHTKCQKMCFSTPSGLDQPLAGKSILKKRCLTESKIPVPNCLPSCTHKNT